VCRNPARPDCGLVLGRDLNAALHLATLASSPAVRRRVETPVEGRALAAVMRRR
jgi:transposase